MSFFQKMCDYINNIGERAAKSQLERELGYSLDDDEDYDFGESEPLPQMQYLYFDENGNNGLPKPPSNNEILNYIDNGPMSRWIRGPENQHNYEVIRRILFKVLKTRNHNAGGCSMGLFGPASVGKTTLAKLFHETVAQGQNYPFVSLTPEECKNIDDIYKKIVFALIDSGVDLQFDNNSRATCPPIIVFFDEAHAIPQKVLKGGLLKAMEANDATIQSPEGCTVSTKNVCWIMATTNESRLPAPMRTRLTSINLNFHSKETVARIINASHGFDMNTCKEITKYTRTPRIAKKFADFLITEREMGSYGDHFENVGRSLGLNKKGLTKQQMKVLEALARNTVMSKSNLAHYVGVDVEELDEVILPEMFGDFEDRHPILKTTSRGIMLGDGVKVTLKG